MVSWWPTYLSSDCPDLTERATGLASATPPCSGAATCSRATARLIAWINQIAGVGEGRARLLQRFRRDR